MTTDVDTFLDRLDKFAEGLSPDDQQKLQLLLGDDVSGFGFQQPWPGSRSLLTPIKLGDLTGHGISSGDMRPHRSVRRRKLHLSGASGGTAGL